MSTEENGYEVWEKLLGRKLIIAKHNWLPPKGFLSNSEYVTLQNLIENRLTGGEPIQLKTDWFTTGVVYSNPKMLRGNLGNGFLSFEVIDPLTLSYVTPILVDLKARYARDFDFSGFLLPQVLDFVCLYQPKCIAGVESYSRRALSVDCQCLKRDFIIPSRNSFGKSLKRDASRLNKASVAFIVGKASTLNLCRHKNCKVVVDSSKHELCDAHLSQKFNRMKGQRMEIATSAWGFDLYDSSKKPHGQREPSSQFLTRKGPESFLLESEEMVTQFPSSSDQPLSAADLEKREARISQLEEDLSLLKTPGGQMIKDAIEAREAKRKRLDPKAKIESREPMSLAACSEMARKLLKAAGETSGYKGVSAKKVFEKFQVHQTLSSKQKIAELLRKVDSEDADKVSQPSLKLNIKD